MDTLDLTSPFVWGSIVVGALLLAVVSAGFQRFQGESQELNPKGLVRDGLLGGIFTAMAWTLVPESMQSLTSGLSSSVSTITTSVADSAKSADIDLQIGPARF